MSDFPNIFPSQLNMQKNATLYSLVEPDLESKLSASKINFLLVTPCQS